MSSGREGIQIPNSGACTLGGVLRLPKPDGDGCNWQRGGLIGIYSEGFRQAVGEILAKYNLEDEA